MVRKNIKNTHYNPDPVKLGQDYHIVVAVEWDGQPPSMTYYDRLHKEGIFVHGGDRKEFDSPLDRRNNMPYSLQKAVVYQEGLYLCRNFDIARLIADLADDFGASAVSIGTMYMTQFRLTDADVKVLEGYKQAASRRGPKPQAEKGRYVVTCFREVLTFEAELEALPHTCPSCGSFMFTAVIGKCKEYVNASLGEGDVLDWWLRTRFGMEDRFEIPKSGGVKAPPLTSVVQRDFPKLNLPVEVREQLDRDPWLMLRVLDAVYCLEHFAENDRRMERMNVINGYIIGGGQKPLFMGVLNKDEYDLIDLCILIPDLARAL